MKKTGVTTLLVLVMLLLIPILASPGIFDDHGTFQVQIIDLVLDPADTTRASYTLSTTCGRTFEGSCQTWIEVDQMHKLIDPLLRSKTGLMVTIEENKVIRFQTRSIDKFKPPRRKAPWPHRQPRKPKPNKQKPAKSPGEATP